MFPQSRPRFDSEDDDNHHDAKNANQHHIHHQHKIPIPTAVQLYNLMAATNDNHIPRERTTSVSSLDDQQQPQQPKQEEDTPQWLRRPPHDVRLLPRVRLDILVTPQPPPAEQQQLEDSIVQQQVVYSSTCPYPSVHPSWEHLNERLSLPDHWWMTTNSYNDNNYYNIYPTMKLQFWIINTTKKPNQSTGDENVKLFLQVPLYPGKLERLPSPTTEEERNNNLINLPLPPNTCLMHFSDGSLRVLPSVLEILQQAHVVPKPRQHIHDQVVEDFSRFEDDVFSTLDHVTPSPTTTNTNKTQQQQQQQHAQNLPYLHSNGNDHRHVTTLRPRNKQQQHEDGEGLVASQKGSTAKSSLSTFDMTESDAMDDDVMMERQRLQELIRRERQDLERERSYLTRETLQMRQTMTQLQILQDQRQTLVETHQQEKHCHIANLKVQNAQSIKCLQELATHIYPIRLDKTQGCYVIRSLRLPVDIYTNTLKVPEDEWSAALGYVCHLVILVSKYCQIPLRHKIYCHASRSAIQQDGHGNMYPLFLTTTHHYNNSHNNNHTTSNNNNANSNPGMMMLHVEKEQLEIAMVLLGQDVNAILKTRGITNFTPTSHILARLLCLYQDVLVQKQPPPLPLPLPF